MHKTDLPDFHAILDDCAIVCGAKKPDDQRVQLYWNALRDLDIATVRAAAQLHQRYGKYFPKPSELRPKVDKVPGVKDPKRDAEFQHAATAATQHFDEYLARAPLEAKWQLLRAYISRVEASEASRSLFRDQRMSFVREAYAKLLEQSGGAPYIATNLDAIAVTLIVAPNTLANA